MTKLCFFSLMTLGLAACGGDPAENNQSTNNATPDMTTGGMDMPATGMDMAPEADMPATGMDMAPEADMPAPVDMGGEPAAESCTSANPPERCSANPDEFSDWAPASVVSRLELTTADDCCYDYTGNQEINNALGKLIDQLGGAAGFGLEDVNGSIAEAIADGSVALVLEHQGVMPATGGPFAINFMLGEQDGDFTAPSPDGGNQYKIDPVSFEAGVWPQARIGNANLDGTSVTSGQGVVAVAINLFDITLTLRITAAQVEATVASADDKGVKLTDGKLGGVLRVDDLIGALNSFTSTNCGCLGLENGELLTGDIVDGYECAAINDTCNAEVSIENTCSTIAGQCNLIKVIPTLADVNSSNIGMSCESQVDCDAISVGFTFDAEGAVITGVAPAE